MDREAIKGVVGGCIAMALGVLATWALYYAPYL